MLNATERVVRTDQLAERSLSLFIYHKRLGKAGNYHAGREQVNSQ
jgi:hypothetical protein